MSNPFDFSNGGGERERGRRKEKEKEREGEWYIFALFSVTGLSCVY